MSEAIKKLLRQLDSPMDAGNAFLPDYVVLHFDNPAQTGWLRDIVQAAVNWDGQYDSWGEDSYQAERSLSALLRKES